MPVFHWGKKEKVKNSQNEEVEEEGFSDVLLEIILFKLSEDRRLRMIRSVESNNTPVGGLPFLYFLGKGLLE
ncbi:hypothetical protein HAX54_001511, partial [Datura stramonium]|nr:hypothetical protein [Datura stramonium]